MDNPKPAARRIGGKKGKSSANFCPITVEYKNVNEDKIPEDIKQLIHKFLESTSTESQLAVTKSILVSVVHLKDVTQEYVIKFLVLVIVESELKHPVKCLLIRQVDQLDNIHDIFMNHLSQLLQSYEYAHITGIADSYPKCVKFVLGLSSCFENFSLGVKTVENIAFKILDTLTYCILCCIDKLKCVLPRYKLETSKKIHEILHLYLNVCHKATSEDDEEYYRQIRNMSYIAATLLFKDEISMDSKALCAVIYVTMHKYIHDPWWKGLPMDSISSWDNYWETEESVLLCLYYALITGAPADLAFRLDFISSHEVAEHILTLIKNVVHITDRLSGSVSVSLCGARALAAASVWLNTAGPIHYKSEKHYSNKEQSDSNKEQSDSSKEQSDSNKEQSDSNKEQSDSNKEQSDSNKEQSDSNKEQSDSSKEQSDSNKEQSDSSKEQSDSNKEQSDSNKEQSDSNKEQSDSDNIEFNLNLGESESYKLKSEPEILDPWAPRPMRKQYKEGEIYMGRTLELARVLVKFAERLLQHHAPALRHLAEQIQANVMLYYLRYHHEEVTGWLNVEDELVRDKLALVRRVGASRVAGGGAILRAALSPSRLLPLLHNDHKQPHVSALLETYIERDCEDLDSGTVFERWFPPALESVRGRGTRPLTAIVLDLLIKLLAKAIDVQDQLLAFVLPLIENPDATTSANLKCTLFLMNVISKSKASKKYQDADDKWKGLISYDVLEAAILDDDDQVVRLCMCAAWAGHGGARVVLAFLRERAHRPRALHVDTLRSLTQFIKNLEKEYRSCNDNEKYVEILLKLRSSCVGNLVRGANHYRRGIALFLLKTICDIQFEGYQSEWSQREVESVIRHLDDSYERNKQLALDILRSCPRTLLREAVLSNNMASIESILETVSSRARDAEGAAYKVELLVTTLPDILLDSTLIGSRAAIESVRHAACRAALTHSSFMHRPSYRVAALTLLRTQLERLPITCEDGRRVSEMSHEWYQLALDACQRSYLMLEYAAPLVEAASPEGHVPQIFFGRVVEPHPYQPHLYMVGEETMTSQAMLLHAWTSAKEAWLILARASHFLNENDVFQWRLNLATRLARARHRAVHDHATKAFVTILRRLPDMDVSSLGATAVQWAGEADGTRRAAGLAGLVLALACARPDLTHIDLRSLTAIHKTGAHHAAMAVLRARETARAVHDVLPALVRHALQDADSNDAALQWACVGVVGAGVRRIAGAHAPGAGAGVERGRLRTSVFMSRYPGLYEYILERVDSARVREKSMCASVACSLLLMSRLLPDASTPCTPGEHLGAEAACASPSYHTRRLAAAAAAANLPHTMYIEHATFVLNTLSNKDIAKNMCHGLILRLLAMINEAPELPWTGMFAAGLPPTLWIVESPCFPLVHEYLHLLTVLLNRYPSCLDVEYRTALGAACGRTALGPVVPGAQLCLARALALAAALSSPSHAAHLISQGLNSHVHEVCLASLECMVSALGETRAGSVPVAAAVWVALGEPALLDRVARIMYTHVHLECRLSSLHVLVLEGAHEHIFGEKYEDRWADSLDMWIVKKLTWYIRQCGDGQFVCGGRGAPPCPRGEPLYVRALSTHLHSMRAAAAAASDVVKHESVYSARCRIELVSETMWRLSGTLGEWHGTRDAVRDLVREHAHYLTTYDDDSLSISMYLCAATAQLSEGYWRGALGHHHHHPALLLALALLYFDFDDQTDDDQYQTCDSETDSELYDEGVWTDRCTDMLIDNYTQTNPGQTITPYVLSLIQKYGTLDAVCGIHLSNFMKLLNGESEIINLHSKVELFVSKLKAFDASC